MISLKLPADSERLLKLGVGDNVLLNGTIFTARDIAHDFLLKNDFRTVRNSMIYHCGPIVKGKEVIAAGPTTSSRLNQYTPQLVEKYGVKAIIGKGGMDESVVNALKGKAVYLSAVGGAAVLYAKSLKVKGVHKPEFGMADAIWELEARDFPAIVTIDSKGNSLYKEVYEKSKSCFLSLIRD